MEKIDFVIAWVDGNDPAWQTEKAKYKPDPQGSDNRAIRYRDWDTLHYWFRAVEKYAPWVNRIHFITWGHVPAWLNTEHPKLHIVNHRDYIPGEYLPVFSSHPIELNLHRIEGLAEQFVYFNDDFFLTAPVKPEDFFLKGLPRDSLEEAPLDLSWRNLMVSVNSNDVLYANLHYHKPTCRRQNLGKWYSWRTPAVAAKNLLLSAVSRRYFFGFNIHHLPQAYRKETLEQVWKLEPQWLHETCTHRFRDASDVSQCVFKFHQLATGAFVPVNKRRFGKWYPGGMDALGAAEAIRGRKYRYICFNDSDKIDFETNKRIIHQAFQAALPEKCGFEL